MYASDHEGLYPPGLNLLVSGNHLKLVPTCPAAAKDTYSKSYVVTQRPDNFSFCCQGNNHARSLRSYGKDSSNFPQYNGEIGLIGHP